jgi:LPS-assembly lipoprotein
MTRRLILILASLSIVSGCGFALRGNVNIPEALSTMAVVGNDLSLVDQLKDALSRGGVNVTDKNDKNAAVIDLGKTDYKREVRTTDSNGLATAYTLRYNVGYNVVNGAGEALQINQKLTQTRVLDFDPLQVLQAQEEEEFLREDMQEEIVLQILRRLSRI